MISGNEERLGKIRTEWWYLPILRIWNIGLNKLNLADWFDSIPSVISIPLKRILSALQQTLIRRISHLKHFQGLQNANFSITGLILEHDKASENGLWDEDDACAHLVVAFDPMTQERRGVAANVLQAELFDMDYEELMSRFANDDVDIPMPDLDLLYLVVDSLMHESHVQVDRYFRLYNQHSRSPRAVLVSSSSRKKFNSTGQVVQVSASSR